MDKETYENYQAQEGLQRGEMEAKQAMGAQDMLEQRQQSQAVLLEQINPRQVVNDIMNRLRGYRSDAFGNDVKVSQAKMNQKGIENIWFILDSHINQNITISHLEEDEIARIMISLQDDLVDDLALNWKHYGIENKTDLDNINDSILMNIFTALKRAQGQNEKNFLGKVSVESISGGQSHLPKPKKESFWDKFKLGG